MMSANQQAKQAIVAEISDRIARAQSIVLVDYKGLTVAEDTELRRKMRAAGVEYKVLKNTLVRRALNDAGITELDAVLNGSTAFAFSYEDPVGAAKVIKEFMANNKKMSVKAGLLGDKVIDVAGVQYLADLPSKETLIAKLMGTLNAPMSNMVGVLAGPARALVCAINAIKDQKEQGA